MDKEKTHKDDAARGGQAITRSATQVLVDRLRESPYLTLGAAAGIGFLIGTGFWRPATRAVVGVCAQVAIGAALSDTRAIEP